VSEYITLLGAEQVQSAARTMANAADEMRHAAGNIDEALRSHQRFLDDWLIRFQQAMEQPTSKARSGFWKTLFPSDGMP